MENGLGKKKVRASFCIKLQKEKQPKAQLEWRDSPWQENIFNHWNQIGTFECSRKYLLYCCNASHNFVKEMFFLQKDVFDPALLP